MKAQRPPSFSWRNWLLAFVVLASCVPLGGYWWAVHGRPAQLAIDPPEQDAAQSARTDEQAPVAFDPSGQLPATREAVIAEAHRLTAWLIAQFPGNPDSHEVSARVAFWLGDSAEAVRSWQKCLDLDPNYGFAYHGMGLIAAKAGDHEKAVGLFRKTLELSPKSPIPQIDLAESLMHLARLDEAVDLLEDNVRDFPDPTPALVLLGKAYLQKNEPHRAKRAFDAVLRRQPEHPKALYGMVTAYTQMKDEEKAGEYLAKFKLVRGREKEERYAAGARNDDAASMRPALAAHYTIAGRACEQAGDVRHAEDFWRRAGELDPSDIESRESLAQLHRRTQRVPPSNDR